MTSWVLVGGGAFAREVIGWIRSDAQGGASTVRGYVAQEADAGMDAYGVAWLGKPSAFQPVADDQLLLVIGDPAAKRKVVGELAAHHDLFASFVHSSALVHFTAKLGVGVVVCPRSVVSADARIGDFVTINLMCSIGHDVVLGDYSNLSAHVDLTGYVQVGEDAFFGSGARVLPRVKIGERARVGAGATVVRSLAPDTSVYTTPAKRI
ncbi:NeuD/PglB/VioB family sugar acetyltransferase [uncultured Ramlibacter sp.]|uniref:NeuD/PglB/VioB family sugar acetyltransferase n=1 Tax=uncultured Ramlibacter sp. TaxID=260755 RepID=UPI0026382BF4|nr:NeuD/PglB/VioB family sugar acetyltransferase [uncultured Ramlibacter sp.]